jgi:hypothetical protein
MLNWQLGGLCSVANGRLNAIWRLFHPQVHHNLASGRRLIVLINYTARNGVHFGQQGATYVQATVMSCIGASS